MPRPTSFATRQRLVAALLVLVVTFGAALPMAAAHPCAPAHHDGAVPHGEAGQHNDEQSDRHGSPMLECCRLALHRVSSHDEVDEERCPPVAGCTMMAPEANPDQAVRPLSSPSPFGAGAFLTLGPSAYVSLPAFVVDTSPSQVAAARTVALHLLYAVFLN